MSESKIAIPSSADGNLNKSLQSGCSSSASNSKFASVGCQCGDSETVDMENIVVTKLSCSPVPFVADEEERMDVDEEGATELKVGSYLCNRQLVLGVVKPD